jgi:hypothetical protein
MLEILEMTANETKYADIDEFLWDEDIRIIENQMPKDMLRANRSKLDKLRAVKDWLVKTAGDPTRLVTLLRSQAALTATAAPYPEKKGAPP